VALGYPLRRVAWLALACAGIFAAYLAVLFVAQRSMLFPRPPGIFDAPPAGAEEVRVPFDGGEAYALLLPPGPRGQRSNAPLLMFMHGNGELADYWTREFDEPRAWGIGVLLVEYPGYGRAPGAPSEQSITESVRALYDWAQHDPRIDATRIVAYGRSLGGGAATRLAVDRTVAALILESAFTSVADFAARFLAPSFLIRDRFDNRKTLTSYRGPLLMIHGRLDTIVPIAHARELAALVPGAVLEELNCDHNDCPRQWRTIAAFLHGAGVLSGSVTEDPK
jgi:fermentation-respiration switch protein FrsA (DUF1100 family)